MESSNKKLNGKKITDNEKGTIENELRHLSFPIISSLLLLKESFPIIHYLFSINNHPTIDTQIYEYFR